MNELLLARTILHLGSGMKSHSNAVNLDIVPDTNPDIIHDLDKMPWPVPKDHFREVWAYDVIEHLDDIVKIMEEINRVCADGAIVKVTVPHFSCVNAFTDPTHRHFFSTSTFDYFTGQNKFGYYAKCKFRKRIASLIFHPSLINRIVQWFANRWKETYERRWAWIFPAWFLYFELEVIKNRR